MDSVAVVSPPTLLTSPRLEPKSPRSSHDKAPKRSPAFNTSHTEAAAKVASTATKPKQSKSRNGCITCKAKRLKCDETKPSCQQCHKRSVHCGGYKKDFKWRPFEETSFTSKSTPSMKLKKGTPPHMTFHDESPTNRITSPSSARSTKETFTILPPDREGNPAQRDFTSSAAKNAASSAAPPKTNFGLQSFSTDVVSPSESDPYGLDSVTSNVPETVFADGASTETSTGGASSFSGQSPKLMDLLLPGTDLRARPQEYLDYQSRQSEQTLYEPQRRYAPSTDVQTPDDDVEEIVRQPDVSPEPWTTRFSLLSSSSNSSSSSEGSTLGFFNRMYIHPSLHADSPEQLTRRFDEQTCGILSITDGPTENPWRTLVWPLAMDSPALYHAIASMTAFHTAREQPALRVAGLEHMRQSMLALGRADMDFMRTDTALATTLVLAFSESWDQQTSTGIQHLRGARTLVRQAFAGQNARLRSGESLRRLKFLVNTWVYMDVIARLTSTDDNDSADVDSFMSSAHTLFGPSATLDPLMGCATTLFPLIGRVANLIRKVRTCPENTPSIISQAASLKSEIEYWEIPRLFNAPEDPTSAIEDSLQTAESYRWATLLYLHQAVPELPSLSSAQLAKKVLNFVATVPLSSRAVIIQIYPLLVASCEVEDEETREWVKERWKSMSNRMWIGTINKCWEVVREVWVRRAAYNVRADNTRDAFLHAPAWASDGTPSPAGDTNKRKVSPDDDSGPNGHGWTDDPGTYSGGGKRRITLGELGLPNALPVSSSPGARSRHGSGDEYPRGLDHEMTVRGRLHWVGVMKDWGWEVLLG